MTMFQQIWLVALREMRERSRSPAFRASILVVIVTIVAMIVLPAALSSGTHTRDVGLTGSASPRLVTTIQSQAAAVGTTARLHDFPSVELGERAVRAGDVDVLVVDGRRLEWPRRADQPLKSVLTGAIQLVTVQDRASAAGIPPSTLAALTAPVAVANVELTRVAGRSAGDETAAVVMTSLLLLTISVYGGLVLGGVVEEKSSRVVEVLLARIPARSLLAGKVLGIGLLGLAQVAVTAAAALVATATVGSLDVPAVRGGVLAWAVVWFVLGYALYATLYGALGSLASRSEDAQSVAAPAMTVMAASYFAAFITVGRADGAVARVLSYFPTSAPFAMPGRIAMGTATWWDPVVAVGITLAATVGLVRLGGRLYASAILHTGATPSLHDAWRAARAAASAPGVRRGRDGEPTRSAEIHRDSVSSGVRSVKWTSTLTAVAVIIGTGVAVVTSDVINGVIAGASVAALAGQLRKAWTGRGPRQRHP